MKNLNNQPYNQYAQLKGKILLSVNPEQAAIKKDR